MIRDPRHEVIAAGAAHLSAASPDDVDPATLAALRLARRRFGVALPPPFIAPPRPDAAVPLRALELTDLGALEVVVQRSGFVAPATGGSIDALLGSGWRTVVAGGRGEVFGFVAVPTSPQATVEIWGPVIDPTVPGRGLADELADAAESLLRALPPRS